MIENRKQIWADYLAQGGMDHKVVKHMFLAYERYHEASLIRNNLLGELAQLRILDYGCGVGDYGILLLREGTKQVDFYDFPRALKLVEYRLSLPTSWGSDSTTQDSLLINPDIGQKPNFLDYDLIIFGEVLEHLENPKHILKNVALANVNYIFTSSYPYRSEDPDDPYWSNHDHGDEARLQIPDCKKILESNYSFVKFDGELRLWRRK